MNRVAKPRARLLGLLVAAALPSTACAQDGWDWIIAPYVWLPNISVDIDTSEGSTPEDPSANLDFFPEVLDKLDGAFLIHAEGQGDTWGMFTDFIYLGLADGNDFDRAETSSDMDARLFELAAVYSPGPGRYEGFDLFGGLRYIDLDLTVEIDPTNPAFQTRTADGGDSFADFMVGARYHAALSEKWGLSLRGDGSWGDTEGTWSVGANFQYRVNRGSWVFGYRYLDGELKPNDNVVDVTLNGPLVGFAFEL